MGASNSDTKALAKQYEDAMEEATGSDFCGKSQQFQQTRLRRAFPCTHDVVQTRLRLSQQHHAPYAHQNTGRLCWLTGYLFCNLPGLEVVEGQRVRFYYMALGTEVDLHTPGLRSASQVRCSTAYKFARINQVRSDDGSCCILGLRDG